MQRENKPYEQLRCEIEAMVPTIMAGPLSRWGEWTEEDKLALVRYIEAEMDGCGDLSIQKGIECEAPMGGIRAQARRLLKRLRKELEL